MLTEEINLDNNKKPAAFWSFKSPSQTQTVEASICIPVRLSLGMFRQKVACLRLKYDIDERCINKAINVHNPW